MAAFTKFEDIVVWQKSRLLFSCYYEQSKACPLWSDFALKNQMDKSCGSIMDNIAEGFGRMGNNEFVHFLTIALGSLREFQSQLYRCLDKQHFCVEVFNELNSKSNEVGRMLVALISALRNSELRGLKFKE